MYEIFCPLIKGECLAGACVLYGDLDNDGCDLVEAYKSLISIKDSLEMICDLLGQLTRM